MSDNVEKKGLFAKMADSFKGYKSEFKKIVWPSWNTVLKNTGVVVVFILVLGLFIYAVDMIFGLLFGLVTGL